MQSHQRLTDSMHSNSSRSALRLDGVTHRFGTGQTVVTALHGVHVEITPGELVAVMGPSGSGKSTLLACAAGLLEPTEGAVEIGGRRIAGLDDDALTELRRTEIGFVFQDYSLVPALSARDNVRLPASLGGQELDAVRLTELIGRLGIEDRLDHLPTQLSGGQQQRVAIARALSMSPSIVLADEPTGALDTATASEVLDLLVDEAGRGQATIVVTHDPVVATRADRILFLRDGMIARESARLSAREISDVLLTLIEGTAAEQRS